MKIVISSGHGLHVRGASDLIDEVTEARRIVPRVAKYLRMAGCEVVEFHENNARNQTDNVNAIIREHNSHQRDLDVSVHLNSVDGGTREAGIGVETLYLPVLFPTVDTKALASKISRAISNASGLILRRGDGTLGSHVGFLRLTTAPAVLIEVCFVNSRTDVRLYRQYFDDICRSIAEAIIGRKIKEDDDITIINELRQLPGLSTVTERDVAEALAFALRHPKPTGAAVADFQAAIDSGITDGSAPGGLAPRWVPAVMTYRAKRWWRRYKKGV